MHLDLEDNRGTTVLSPMCCALLSRIQLFATPWAIAHQAPLSMGILQAKILDWVAMPTSSGFFQTRDQTQVSHS